MFFFVGFFLLCFLCFVCRNIAVRGGGAHPFCKHEIHGKTRVQRRPNNRAPGPRGAQAQGIRALEARMPGKLQRQEYR